MSGKPPEIEADEQLTSDPLNLCVHRTETTCVSWALKAFLSQLGCQSTNTHTCTLTNKLFQFINNGAPSKHTASEGLWNTRAGEIKSVRAEFHKLSGGSGSRVSQVHTASSCQPVVLDMYCVHKQQRLEQWYKVLRNWKLLKCVFALQWMWCKLCSRHLEISQKLK